MSWRIQRKQDSVGSSSNERDPNPKRAKAAAGEPAAAAGAGPTKRKGKTDAAGKHPNKTGHETIDIAELLPGLLKSQLQLNQQVRQLQGISVTTFLLKAESALVVEAQLAGVNYDQQVREDGPGHPWGPPHPHIFMAAVEGLNKQLAADTEFEGKGELAVVVAALQKLEIGQVAELILYWQVRLCYVPLDKGKKDKNPKDEGAVKGGSDEGRQARVSFAFNPIPTITVPGLGVEGPQLSWTIKKVLVKALLACGAQEKQGPPPRGELERLMQAYLRRTQGQAVK